MCELDVDLTVAAGDAVRVRVNGKLACEIAAGVADDRDTLERQIAQARCARAGMSILLRALDRLGTIHNREDHVHTSPEAKRAAYMRGLCDGAQRKTALQHEGLFATRPEHTPSYDEGYNYGEAIARAARGATEAEEAPVL